MTLEEAKKDMERFVSLKTSMRPAFVDVLLQAEEVHHGVWKTWYHGDTTFTYSCSNCGIGGYLNKTRFCPCCGARMNEEELKDGEGKAGV